MKSILALYLLLVMILCIPLQAQNNTDEITSIRKTVSEKIKKFENIENVSSIREYLQKVNIHISETDKFLNDEENEKAYYSVSIALAYIGLIESMLSYENSHSRTPGNDATTK